MFAENLIYFGNKIFLYMCNSYLNEKKYFYIYETFYLFQWYFRRIHIFHEIFLYELFFTMPSKLCIFCQGRVFWRCCDLFLCKMLNAYLDKRLIFSQLYFSGLGLTRAMNANLLFIFSKTRNECTFRHENVRLGLFCYRTNTSLCQNIFF